MKKPLRLILIAAGLVVLALGWTWRYVTLNRYYDDLDNKDYQLYQAGELVPFEDDGNDMEPDWNGYLIRVDGYTIRDYHDYLRRSVCLCKKERRKRISWYWSP